ncbi:SIR2 family protein [Vibrio cholerae]
MDIPDNLINEIKRGRVVLFLGAGASMGSISKSGKEMFSANALRDKLCERFLGDNDKDLSLASVAELSISESDKVTVQQYIKELFEDFEPCDFHRKLPKYKWSTVFTTNYDLLIEGAYDVFEQKSQSLVPIIRTTDRMDSMVKPDEDLAYIKLHGCISRINETDPELILTADQYATHQKKRNTLFERLKSLGTSHTVLFIGHSLEDSDIRAALSEIQDLTDSRPRYYALMLGGSDRQKRLWESKRITVLNGTFKAFMDSLDSQVTDIERALISISDKQHPIERKFVNNDFSLTPQALSELNNSLRFVDGAMPSDTVDPKMFYKGYSQSWTPISQELDVRRKISDEIVSDIILIDENERNSQSFELYHLSGFAGSGKSVILRRVAWDAATDYDKICLYWDSNERLPFKALLEIAEKVGERIFLFVDNASSHVSDILALNHKFNQASLPLTCIAAERTNEWNIECSPLQSLLSDKLEVGYLSIKEIDRLLELLERHNALGELKKLSPEKRREAFSEKAGRQLLVALHEVTMSKSFEQIIRNEYDNIVPRKAQLIYRTICIMNRFDVLVRAGIINRVHGVSFTDFTDRFFSPLESVVKVIKYDVAQDQAYVSRHPIIAEMVFEYSMGSEEERLDTYLLLLKNLDIGYSPDRTAFREMIKYRNLSGVFSLHENIETIYKQIEDVCGDDDFYYQQVGIFYMRSKTPNFVKSEEYLNLAEKFGEFNPSIQHSLAELELARAKRATGLDKDRLLNKADRLAKEISNKDKVTSHSFDTQCKIALQRLEDVIQLDDEELLTDAIKNTEAVIQNALKKFPDDEVILSEEADFAQLISDDQRSMRALEAAHKINPANGALSNRLSKIYLSCSPPNIEKAKEILNRTLDANPLDKNAHAGIASIFSIYEPSEKQSAEHHWRRSFTDGDSNVLNQLWYCRQLYINGKYDDYLEQLSKLKLIRLPPKTKHAIRGLLSGNNDEPLLISGKIVNKTYSFCLLEATGYSGVHFLHQSNCPSDIWNNLSCGDTLEYNLGFTFSGAAAVIKQKSQKEEKAVLEAILGP